MLSVTTNVRSVPVRVAFQRRSIDSVIMRDVSFSRRRVWLAVFLAWTVFGLWSASQYHLFTIVNNRPVEHFFRPFAVYLVRVWIWAFLTIPIAWIARRWPFERGKLLRRVALHLGASVAISAAFVAADAAVYPLISGEAPRRLLTQFLAQLNLSVFSYMVVVAAVHALDYYRAFREKQTRAAELEGQLARSELEVLKMQLQPHFLFNTLHMISELVHENPKVADEMITRLGDLLRLSMQHVGTQEVALKDELEFVSAYIDIQRLRFGDRLVVEMRVDPETLDARLPNLVLQPLVENAIRHGTDPRAATGVIEITARRVNGQVEIRVTDNGRGIPADRDLGREGVGLRNTRARLQKIYGREWRLDLRNAATGGTEAVLAVPYRPAAEETVEPSVDRNLTAVTYK